MRKIILLSHVGIGIVLSTKSFLKENDIIVVDDISKEIKKAFQPEPIPIINHRLDFNPEVQIKNWEPNKYFNKPKNNFKKK